MDVHHAIQIRRSVRSYASAPLPPASLARLRVALRSAPSACNFQPWHFIFVIDEALRRQVAEASFDQLWMADAPLIIVGCGLPKQAYKHMGGRGLSVDVDVTIALDHLTLAAVAEGLGTCWIGAFDENEVKRLLGIPEAVKVVALVPVGLPAPPDGNAPLDDARRKPPEQIFSTDRYGVQ